MEKKIIQNRQGGVMKKRFRFFVSKIRTEEEQKDHEKACSGMPPWASGLPEETIWLEAEDVNVAHSEVHKLFPVGYKITDCTGCFDVGADHISKIKLRRFIEKQKRKGA